MLDYVPLMHVVNDNGASVIHLRGTDASEEAAEAVGRQLYALAEVAPSRRFILNLGDVRCLGSATFGKLIGFHRQVRQRGGEVAVCSLNPDVAAQFERMCLGRLFPIYSTEEEAVGRGCSADSLVGAR